MWLMLIVVFGWIVLMLGFCLNQPIIGVVGAVIAVGACIIHAKYTK